MLQTIRVKWTTVLALLIAVATAWMFAASHPTSPPPGSETEIVCTPEVPVTPGISEPQTQNDPGAPRGVALAARSPSRALIERLPVVERTPVSVGHDELLTVPIGAGYPRGPPMRA